MIINERGLTRALKVAWKRGGYTIVNDGYHVQIYTENWYICADWDKFPRKALATIVEHMGTLPTSDDALLILAGDDPQTVMPELVNGTVAGWLGREDSTQVTFVPVTVRGLQLYQQEKGGNCYGVAPLFLGIVERDIAVYKEATVSDENRLEWQHDGEHVIVMATRPTATNYAEEEERKVWTVLETVDLHHKKE